jgi:ethanolamine-phosphate cytidylyltransferase
MRLNLFTLLQRTVRAKRSASDIENPKRLQKATKFKFSISVRPLCSNVLTLLTETVSLSSVFAALARESNLKLSELEAIWLASGIYEATQCFTHDGTRSSDLQEVVHLMNTNALNMATVRENASHSAIEKKKRVIVWVDGVFDMMHFGHANMFRQAKSLGDYLVVGVNSDESVRDAKGHMPVMNNEERCKAVIACKWVDEVVPNAPYIMSDEYVDFITAKYGVDIIAHGDDPCFVDGKDVYENVKRQGKFRTVKRTEGVSTTELVGRMLMHSKEHHLKAQLNPNEVGVKKISSLLPTTRRFAQFSGGKAPKPGDKIVYMAGSYDLFHCGHTETLKAARALGDFLIVGISDDMTVNAMRGDNWPVMNVFERTLCVLSCRSVDEVVIGAPWEITEDQIKTLNISLVVHGTHHEPIRGVHAYAHDPFAVPKRLGIYREIQSASTLTAAEIVERILSQRSGMTKRFETKAAKEEQYLRETKQYIPEL